MEEMSKGAQAPPWSMPANLDSDRTSPKAATYLLLLSPIILFTASLYIPPRVSWDSGDGFRILQNMLAGGSFNTFTAPDPGNIARDVQTFQTWWSPGQYLVPGSFVWLGSNYAVALSITALVATLIGVLGWIQVARSFAISSFVLHVFVLGLSTFSYITSSFLTYWGGELLLFAVAPWSLYAMCWAASKPPTLCFAISVVSVALLFFAKLTGIIVFGSNVAAISLFSVISRRRTHFPGNCHVGRVRYRGSLLFNVLAGTGLGTSKWIDV